MKQRMLSLMFPIALVSVMAGCEDKTGGDVSKAPATASAVETSTAAAVKPSATASAEPKHARRERGHHGPAMMMLRAARDLPDLKDAQKTALDKLDGEMKPSDTTRAALKDLHADLAAEIKAGKIDLAKLEPRFTAIDKAAQEHQEKEAEALNQLHATLDAAQRKALVAQIRAKQGEHDGEAKEHRGDKDAKGDDWSKRKLEHMTKELGLDDAQQKSVEAILAKSERMTPEQMQAHRDEMKKKMDALLTAFEADTFDAKKLDLSMMPGKKARDGAVRELTELSQIVPILKPEQREKLAAIIERHGAAQAGPGAAAEEEDAAFGMLWEDNPPAPEPTR